MALDRVFKDAAHERVKRRERAEARLDDGEQPLPIALEVAERLARVERREVWVSRAPLVDDALAPVPEG